MKKILLTLFALFTVASLYAQEPIKQENGPILTFEKDTHDFGDIYQGDKVKHTFTFENTGNEPLIITNVQVTCGCTATEWPRDPIAPGQSGDITIQFDSTGKIGRQNKVITVVSNALNRQNRVTIVTNILPKKDDTK
ncbi:MAG: DUF1573 domain-containing protein [Candidatus Cyclobacteriaceae bacterium M2_1C_046]